MQPKPMLSEKKAWPKALSTTFGVSFEKSGSNINRKPSLAPGMSSELMQNTIKITNSSGISTFDIRSMPFCTPPSTMR